MSKARNLSKLLVDSSGDVESGSLDNVPASDDASALTTGTLAVARLPNEGLSLGSRNRIINGGFDIWQRGTSVAPVNSWGPDRFFNTNSAMTWTRATNTLGGPCPYMCTLTGGGSDSRFRFTFELPSSTSQPPFDVDSYWTLSMYCSLNLAGRTMGIGYANSPNDSTDNASTTGTWVSLGGNRYALTVQINAVNTNNKLAMRFSGPFDGPVAEGVGSISVTGVQFEAGSVATPFEWRPYGQEFIQCLRYYINTNDGSNTVGWTLNTLSGQNYHFPIVFPVAMRAAPSMTYVNWVNNGFAGAGAFQKTGKFGTNFYSTASSTINGGYLMGSYTASAEL
jgi:hypothetical protein